MRSRIWGVAPALFALALSACNSTDAMLGPSAGQQPTAVGDAAFPALQEPGSAAEAGGDQSVAASTAAPAGTLDAQAAALSPVAQVQLAPIVGATVESVTPLLRGMSQRAPQRGIALIGSNGGDVTHLMKGYFSAITDDGETTVIYVWDVLDPTGSRLHRIQGQERIADVAAEGWPGVPDATMEAIGGATVDQFAAWRAAHPD